jgi:4-amino-4-deoxy-L-arabinose transferase-like glycosyltransferase
MDIGPGMPLRSGRGAPLRNALIVFVVALAARWLYDAILYIGFGDRGLLGPDSPGFIATAQSFADAIGAGKIHGWQWVGPDPSLMPLFTLLLTGFVGLAGKLALVLFVAVQGVVDAGTCVLAAAIGARFAPRYAIWSGLAAALTPTLIVLSGLVYTDTLFVFFATAALYGTIRWLEAPRWRWAAWSGLALGLAALTRILIVPWAPAAILLMFGALLFRGRLRPVHAAQLLATGSILALCIAPVAGRNLVLHGAWALTPQTGNHLVYWVLPIVRQETDGTAPEKTRAEANAALVARYGKVPHGNPFDSSAKLAAYAGDALWKLGWRALARAWAFGAAINLASPAVVLVPPVQDLPHAGFSDTPGRSFGEKLRNFMFGAGDRLYAWLLTIGLLGVALCRSIQVIGLVALLRRGGDKAKLLLLAGWCAFILAVSGPIASPKYRLPIEPALTVAMGAGLAAIAGRRRRSR